jgi:hypothetical protein
LLLALLELGAQQRALSDRQVAAHRKIAPLARMNHRRCPAALH